MKKCPYCGREQDDSNVNCEKCFAFIPAEEKPKEQPKKVDKKTNKE